MDEDLMMLKINVEEYLIENISLIVRIRLKLIHSMELMDRIYSKIENYILINLSFFVFFFQRTNVDEIDDELNVTFDRLFDC